jgi:sporulation protein YabP
MKDNISYSHSININERNGIYITGVLKIDSFDDEEFLLETNMGYLAIKGENLELIRLDTKDGIVSIKGLIISMSYIEDLKKSNKQSSFFEKVFK